MPIVPRRTKATTDSFPFYFDYTGWPQLEDDDLDTATVTATPSGLTLGAPTVSVDTVTGTERVYVNISSGTSGVTYRVTCLAETVGGSILTGFMDLKVSDDDVSGIVVYPSQLLPYFDNMRAMELLYDENELVDATTGAAIDIPSSDTIDGNARAHAIAARAWGTMKAAVRRGNVYRDRELIDLANDDIRGQMLIELLANIFWCSLLKRRRYVPEEPQGKDQACVDAEEALERLRRGDRIFVLDGVSVTDDDGNPTGDVYGNPLGDSTSMSYGFMGKDNSCRRADRRWWGCTNICKNKREGDGGRCC